MPRIVAPSLVAALLVTLTTLPAPADPPAYTDPVITPEQRQHWSFCPPTRPAVPAVAAKGWVRTPVDAFVLAALEAKGLKPSPEADRLTLVRRLSFDLTGLPPTPAEVDAFQNDKSPDAYEKLVDRLLASPHYGERWAQHWLDVVRFAESNGYEADGERPHAWQYRDYVVGALNADLPYDRFVTEQLAGDLLAAGKDPRTAAGLLHATGLNRCGPVHVVGGNVDPEVTRQEVLIEMVNGVGAAVLGLTVGCARCHDHKFDPISLGDYYRLQAFFAGTRFKDIDLATKAEKDAAAKQAAMVAAKTAPLKAQVDTIDAPVRAKLAEAKRAALDPKMRAALDTPSEKRTAEQKQLAAASGVLLKVMWDEVIDALPPADRAKRTALRAEQSRIEADLPVPPPQAWAVADDPSPPPTHVLKRGDLRKKVLAVRPAYPRVVANPADPPKTRLDLAKWLTTPDHPLTARVVVNRLWQHHFGRGIVGTPNDFGTRGDSPTHPALLDWLAAELTRPTVSPGESWSLKRMHRLMVCSATYRQASRVTPTPEALKADPDNKLLWRMNRTRLEAEAVRDAVLSAAGTLTRTIGGPSVKVPLEPEVYDLIFTEGEPVGLWPVNPDPKQHTRRSLYLLLKRNVRLPMLEAFDQPDTLNPCSARPVSTFAPQALILMNGPFAREQSKAMAADVSRAAGPDAKAQVEAVYRRALGRPPREGELKAAVMFLGEQAKVIYPPSGAAERALADLCLAMFNTNEFVYVP